MSNVISPFPNKRIEYAGVGNPRFVSDIVNLNETLIEAILALIGNPTGNFAIISGFVFNGGTNQYSPGLCYMDGVLYYTTTNLNGGKYLTPNVLSSLPKIFEDSTTKNTYTLYNAIESNTQYSTMPIFNWTMDEYRLNLSLLQQNKADASNVYTKTETYSRVELGSIKKKVVEIGTWNMDTTQTKTIDISAVFTSAQIVSVNIFVKSQYNAEIYPLNYSENMIPQGSYKITGGYGGTLTVEMAIELNGIFDDVAFSNVDNRGFIIIEYV
jgi:hypothetical protein